MHLAALAHMDCTDSIDERTQDDRKHVLAGAEAYCIDMAAPAILAIEVLEGLVARVVLRDVRTDCIQRD